MPDAKTADPSRIPPADHQEVCALTRYTPQHIYRLMRQSKFPQRIRIGENRVGWRLTEIEAWFAARPVVIAHINESETHIA